MAWFITVIVLFLCVRFIKDLRGCLAVLLICSAVISLCIFFPAILGLVTTLAMTYGLYLIIKDCLRQKGNRENVSKNKEQGLTPEQKTEIKKRLERSQKIKCKEFHCRADLDNGYLSAEMKSFISSCNKYVENRERAEEERKE